MVSTLNWILMAQADIADAVNSALESNPEVAEAVANVTQSTSVKLHWLDWAVIIGYFVIIAGVAIYASRGQNTASDFFLGSRNRLTVAPAAMAITRYSVASRSSPAIVGSSGS